MRKGQKKKSSTLLIAAKAGARRTTVRLRERGREKFWAQLERYVYQRAATLQGKWQWAAIGIVAMVVGLSVVSGYYGSPTLGSDRQKIIWAAAKQGDYELAQTLFEQIQDSRGKIQVLGADSKLEEVVYPERRIARDIGEWEAQLEAYPGHRDILLTLALLHKQAGNMDMAEEYWGEARKLDPNGERVEGVGQRLGM